MRKFYLSLIALCVTVCSFAQTTRTVGGAGADYPTLKTAFDAINAGSITGAITLNIIANTTETAPAVLNSDTAGASDFISLLIQPIADNLTITGTGVTGRGIIELNGSDNVTINGDNPNSAGTNRNLTIVNNAATTVNYSSVIRIGVSTTVITTADNNTIKNLNIVGNAVGRNITTATSTSNSEASSYGILAGSRGTATTNTQAPAAVTSISTTIGTGASIANLTVDNNSVTSVGRAIMVQGGATTVAPGLLITNNTVGNPVNGDANGVYSVGIGVNGSTGAIVSGNSVFVEGYVPSSGANAAIAVGEISSSTSATVTRNIIGKVKSNSTSGYNAWGISFNGGNSHVASNNFIYNLNIVSSGLSTTFGVFGIRVNSGTGHSILHNSIHLTGAISGTSGVLTTAVGIVGTGQTGVTVRNNILSNQLTGGSTSATSTAHVSLYLPSGGTATMNLNINNNIYYQGGTALSGIAQVGNTAGTGFYTAANFNAAATTGATNLRTYTSSLGNTSNDASSYGLILAPPFISATNLHINPSVASPVEGNGASTSITTDIDGDARNASTPDIGADEGSFTALPATDISVVSLASPGAVSCNTTPTTISVVVKNTGLNPINFSTNNMTVTATVSGAGTGSATVTITTGTLAPNASQTVVLSPAINTSSAGTYNIAITANLSGDGDASNNSGSYSTSVTATPTVGIPQSVDFTGFTGSNLSTVFPGWTEASGTTPTGTTSTWTNVTTLGQTTARVNLYTNSRKEWIISPKIAVTANTSLKFDAALTAYNSATTAVMGSDDQFQIKVSTDCGLTWTDLLTINATNAPTELSNTLRTKILSLGSYAGQAIYVAFYGTDGSVDDAPDYDVHIDNIVIAELPNGDLNLVGILNPAAVSCENTPSNIIVRIKNEGGTTVDFATANATITANVTGAGTATASATLTSGTLAAGASQDVTLTPAINTSAFGTYNISATVAGTNDPVASNNTTTSTTTVQAPAALPMNLNFTGFTGANLSTLYPGWYEASGTSPQGTSSAWTNTTVFTGNTTIKLNLYTTSRQEWIVSPKFTASAMTVLKFDAALTDFGVTTPEVMGGDDKVYVRVSTNCGATWTDLLVIDSTYAANNLTNSLKTFVLPLSAYSGQNVIVGFYATDGPVDNAPDYDIHLDNIGIGNFPTTDIKVASLASPSAVTCSNASNQIVVTVSNDGILPINFATNNMTVTANVTGSATGTFTATVNSGTLAVGASQNITLTPALNTTTFGSYNISVSAVLAGDMNAVNDTLTVVSVNQPPATLPQILDFTGYTSSNLSTLYPGWSEGFGYVQPTGTTSEWVANTNYPNNTTASVNLYTTGMRDWLVSPKFSVTADTKLKFDMSLTDWNTTNPYPAGMGSDDSLVVRISTDCGITWSDLLVIDSTAASSLLTNVLTTQTISLSAYAGQTALIAFYGAEGSIDNSNDYDIHVDNIAITDVPPCTGSVGGTATVQTSAFCTSGSTTVSATGYSPVGSDATYQWEVSIDNTNWTPILNAITPASVNTGLLTDTTYYRLKVVCGASAPAYSNVVTLFVNPAPSVVATGSNTTAVCEGSTVPLMVTGNADTYVWTPAAGLNVTTGSTVNATPQFSTNYIVTGTTTVSGCATADTVTVTVQPTIFVAATSAADTICAATSVQLNTAVQFTAPNVRITEVTMFRDGTGATVNYPTFIPSAAQDFVEITNLQSYPADLTGYRLEAYGDNGTTATHAITFPSGTIIAPNGVIVIHLGGGTNDIVKGYFATGGSSDSYSSGGKVGIVLKRGSTVIDAVGLGGSATGTYTFNAATGVAASDFSGAAPNLGGNAGVIRTGANDTNTGADWTASTATNLQTIGTANTGYTIAATAGTATYNWTPATGLSATNVANPVASPTSTTTYIVSVTDAATSCIKFDTIKITVTPTTVISTEPSSQNVCVGNAVSFTVAADGSDLSYQWRKDGIAISGATNDTLSIASVAANDAGAYTVIVSGDCGSDTSAIATLSINAPTSITSLTGVQEACTGDTAVFTVTATGVNVTYQWVKNGIPINGATNDSLVLNTLALTDSGTYSIIVAGACGSDTATVVLDVDAATSIATQPVAASVCAGQPANFTVVASGANLTYQWRKNGTPITGATSASFNIASVAVGDTASYDVVITGSCGSITSNPVKLTLSASTSITTQPTAQNVCNNGTVTLSVVAAGSGTLTYQWKKDGVDVAGATASTYVIGGATTANNGSYTVVVTGACGSVTSNAAVVTVSVCPSVPTVDADITEVKLMPTIVRSSTLLRVKSQRATKINFAVTDANGRIVMQFDRQLITGTNDIRLDVNRLSSGTYQIMGITSKGRIETVRMVKE